MIAKIRQSQLAPALLRRRTLTTALVATLIAILYWSLIASDRYVSEAHVIVQKADLASAQSMDITSLLGNLSGGSDADQLLLLDHLLSVDMLQKLDRKLNLRAHFSDGKRDLISRMWSADNPLEWFHRHYLSRVTVEHDQHGGMLVIRAQAYEPEMAYAIAKMLVDEGERFMNEIAHRLAREQVGFLEKQVKDMNDRALKAREAVLSFQNAHSLLSPDGTAENLVGIINHLQARLSELQARRGAMLGYLMDASPDIVDIDLQIAALEKQIEQERRRLASPQGRTLNETVEQYQRLQLEAQFAQDVYKTALIGLEQGRIEATRTLKMVSVLQQPTKPEYPLEPRRLYNTIVFLLVALLVAGVVHLVAAIIRDHRD